MEKRVDQKSVNNAIAILKRYGCKNVGDLNTIDDKSPWDISGLTNEKPFVVEVKNRKIKHDRYNDVMCGKHKLDMFNEQSYYQSFLVFNYFTDNYLSIGNPLHNHKVFTATVPVSTEFEKKGTEKEQLISIKREKLIKLDIED